MLILIQFISGAELGRMLVSKHTTILGIVFLHISSWILLQIYLRSFQVFHFNFHFVGSEREGKKCALLRKIFLKNLRHYYYYYY
jgi:hypothetical protein